MSILAFVGGAWGPFGGDSGFMHDLSQATPTYWLVQAGHTLIGGAGWNARGWVTIAIWSAGPRPARDVRLPDGHQTPVTVGSWAMATAG